MTPGQAEGMSIPQRANVGGGGLFLKRLPKKEGVHVIRVWMLTCDVMGREQEAGGVKRGAGW